MFEGIAAVARADADNVNAAIVDENAEIEKLYVDFAHQASAAGDESIAKLFDEIRGDEVAHAQALETALERLELPA